MTSMIDEAKDSPRWRGARLSIIRALCGCKTVKDFCEYPNSKLNTTTFFGWENGRFNGISKVGARRVIERTKDFNLICSFDWFMFGAGQLPTYDQSLKEKLGNEDLLEHDQFMPIFSQPGIAQLHVSDNAMAPDYISGDLIAGIKQTSIKNYIGLDCIVQLESGDILVRQVHESEKPHRVTLRHNNGSTSHKTLFDVKIIMAAPVIFRYRKPRNQNN